MGKGCKKFDDLQAKNTDYAVEKPETKKAYEEERKAYANLDKARRDSKKVYGPYEALEEALAIINEVSKRFMAPRLEAGAKKAEQTAKRKEEIIADPKRTEKEKDEAAKENAAYQCKAINVTNDAVKYEEKKQKKNK